MLVVSPSEKIFGIEVKGQKAKNFWRFDERQPSHEMYYAFVFVPQDDKARVFIMDSATAMQLWKEYKNEALKRGCKEDNQW
jgi:hypothetical protein